MTANVHTDPETIKFDCGLKLQQKT